MLLDVSIDNQKYTLLMRGVFLSDSFYIPLDELNVKLDWSFYPVFDKCGGVVRSRLGVCDSLENFLEMYPEVLFEGKGCREFIVAMIKVTNSKFIDCDGYTYIGKYDVASKGYGFPLYSYRIYEYKG